MKKILFVYPQFPVTYWGFNHIMSFINKKAAFPPLGLMTIASYFDSDFDIKLIDCNIEILKDKDILWADYILTSSMIVQKDSLNGIINRCNALNRPVVCGGPYPTSSSDKIKNADCLVLGEAEPIMQTFIEDLKNDSLQPRYQSINKPDITKTLPPRFDLIKMKAYSSQLLQFSRGCPFNCEFCDIIEMFGRKPRTKTNAQFLHELQLLYNTNYRGSFFIVDDNFIGNKSTVKNLLHDIIQWQKERKYPFEFYAEASVNLAQDEELMDLMTEAGFSMVFVGLETPDEETLIKMGKKQNVRQSLKESIHAIQKKGLEVTAGFIVGFDSDPENVFDLQKKFIAQSGIPFAMVGILMALPETQLSRRLEKEGRLRFDSAGNNTHTLELNFDPIQDKQKIISGYKDLIKEIYSPKNYFARCRDLILNYMPQKRNEKAPFSYQNFRWHNFLTSARAFIYSLVKQGFSRYSFIYFKYLFAVLRAKPSYFVQAVTLAVYGFHFFKITNQILEDNKEKNAIKKIRGNDSQNASIQKKYETQALPQFTREKDAM